MCTPAMRAIKQARPGRCITLLGSRSGAAAAPFIPELDAVLEYPAPWTANSGRCLPAAGMELIDSLAARRFDAVAIFTPYRESARPAALMCYLAGIPLRLAHCRENPYQLLSDWLPDPEPDTMVRNEVRRQLDLVASIGCTASSAGLSFAVRDSDIASIRNRLAARGIHAGRQWLLLHPGTNGPSRRYPPEQWKHVIRDLSARTGLPMVLTGDAAEQPLFDRLVEASRSKAVSLAGSLDLGELGAAISLASLVISNHPDPAHVALALGTPLLDRLNGISPERAVDAACGLLARSARATLKAMVHRRAG
ncbi:MAG: glycosyltransferase family 9 protein [Telluria sp.]